MAVAVVMDFEGGTLEQYDAVIAKMGLKLGDPMPDGGISHWVTGTESGIRVTDVWETRAQFERFAAEQIGPYSQEAGIPAPPVVTYHEVHNYLVTPGVRVAA